MTAGRRIESPAGLVVRVNANGSIRRIEHGDVVVNLFPGSEADRLHSAEPSRTQ